MIAIGAEIKKERRRKGEELHKETYDLEQLHKKKKTGEHETELSVILKREEFKELIELENSRALFRLKKERYQWGDVG